MKSIKVHPAVLIAIIVFVMALTFFLMDIGIRIHRLAQALD